MKWSDEKIESKRQYFLQQRKEPTGNFTEFVVRVYFSVYKKCSENKNNLCKSSDVSSYKIKYILPALPVRSSPPPHPSEGRCKTPSHSRHAGFCT